LIKDELLRPDINNNEFIYKKLFELLNISQYEEVCRNIEDMKNSFDNFIGNYCNNLIIRIKNIFNKNFKGSLHLMLKEWYKENELESSPIIFDIKTKEFIEYISLLSTHDEIDIIEKISKIVTGYYIEDWQPSELNTFEDELLKIINNVKNIDKNQINESNKITLVSGDEKIEKYLSSNTKISAIGSTMKSNIEELIEEYGESLSEEEKITVLLDIIKRYMWGE